MRRPRGEAVRRDLSAQAEHAQHERAARTADRVEIPPIVREKCLPYA